MKQKVLTVDDSRTLRNMLLVTLNNAGFETIPAEDGIEGL
ncbi:response regulator, partial [Rhizobium ruizarguesonis]